MVLPMRSAFIQAHTNGTRVQMYEHFDEGSALKVLFQLLNSLTYLHSEVWYQVACDQWHH